MSNDIFLKVGDTLECSGGHDGEMVHPCLPFRFRVKAFDSFGNPMDDRGFVHLPSSCTVVAGRCVAQHGNGREMFRCILWPQHTGDHVYDPVPESPEVREEITYEELDVKLGELRVELLKKVDATLDAALSRIKELEKENERLLEIIEYR